MSKGRTTSVSSHPVISRRRLLAAGAGVAVTGGALAGCATGMKVPGTTPKAAAMYQDRPNGLARCGVCKHFISSGMCEIVAGPVSPDGWCQFYALF